MPIESFLPMLTAFARQTTFENNLSILTAKDTKQASSELLPLKIAWNYSVSAQYSTKKPNKIDLCLITCFSFSHVQGEKMNICDFTRK